MMDSRKKMKAAPEIPYKVNFERVSKERIIIIVILSHIIVY